MAKKPTTVPVEAIAHPEDTRTNIPTREQQEAVAEEVRRARLHRNKAADPQLVWRGKDEQDDAVFEVPVLPIFIQEEVQPKALIEALKEEVHAGGPEQLDLFSPPKRKLSEGQRYDFYKHDADWRNRLILGDSLEVMVSLAEREGLGGKVQMVFLDPPYGIDFKNNAQPRVRGTGEKGDRHAGIPREPEQIRAFRDTWELGVHSYLGYLRDRLSAAHRLLADTGSVFVQIGDENVHRVRCLLDEVFGPENFVSQIEFVKTSGQASKKLACITDYILWYAKSRESSTFNQLYHKKIAGGSGGTQYSYVVDEFGMWRSLLDDEDPAAIAKGCRSAAHDNLTSQGYSENTSKSFVYRGRSFPTNLSKGEQWTSHWKTTPDEGLPRLARAERLVVIGNTLRYVRHLMDLEGAPMNALWTDVGTSGFSEKKVYVVQTNPEVVRRCVLLATNPGDLVLDPTCGSGTTAVVAERTGRRWIAIDSSRVSVAIARTRIVGQIYPYYLLVDSHEGREAMRSRYAVEPPSGPVGHDVRKGFVYERTKHIRLKDIAYNARIDEVHGRFQGELDALRDALCKGRKRLEEWEVPREAPPSWSEAQQQALTAWWALRRERFQQIQSVIETNAGYEDLYDRPLDDDSRVRVTGPFTVESLAPFIEVRDRDAVPKSEAGVAAENERRFHARVLENLTRAGVQNKTRAERLQIASVRPFQGAYVHAIAETVVDEGKTPQQIAVCIGPQYGTVGATLVKRALDEATAAKRFDQVLVLGFAFDADAQALASPPKPARPPKGSEGFALTTTAKEGPRLALVLMAFDLLTEGLKSSKNANLFLVFGEPDVALEQRPDGLFTVTVRGVDRYRFDEPIPKHVPAALDDDEGDEDAEETPAGGTKDAVACWFLDTNYDGECFRVRQAYFTGKGVFDKLAKALKADIDPAVWNDYYQTTSRPFPRPSKGNVAVKVIDDYGHEFLRVLPVRVEKGK